MDGQGKTQAAGCITDRKEGNAKRQQDKPQGNRTTAAKEE